MSADPSSQLLALLNGFQVSQAISVAATLGIPDLVRDRALSCDALAAATNTRSSSLYRLLRALAAVGVLHERADRLFSLAPLGEPLCLGAPSSKNAWARLIGRPYYYHAWCDLIGSLRTGETAFNRVHGISVWDFRAQRPDEAAIFDRTMATIADQAADAVLSEFDFSRFSIVVDVGGGEGAFLARILAVNPMMQGILFDQNQVVERAKRALLVAGILDRCQVIGGSFFKAVPSGGDAYLLKWILHDWNDQDAITILRSCRRAIRPDGVLIVVDHLVEPYNEGVEGKLMDLNMMVITGGTERTRPEFGTIFEAAGFRLARVTQTRTSVSVIEATPT
jgi:SAM-dependent methyltransferase